MRTCLIMFFMQNLARGGGRAKSLLSEVMNVLWHVSHVYTCTGAKSLQSCPTLCNPIDCSLPGSSVHGTFQARVLEWVVIPSPRRSSQPRGRTRVSHISCIQVGSLPLVPPGKPLISVYLSSKLLKLHTLSMYSFLYVNPASIKGFFLSIC